MKLRFTCLTIALIFFVFVHSSNAQVALHFAGGDDRVTGVNANLPQGNAARTIEAWIKYSNGNNMSIFNYGTFSPNQKFTLHLYNGVYIIGEGNDLNTGYAVNDGNWHHVAVTHDGTTTIVYVDGTVRGTRTTSYNTTGTNFEIGANLRNGYEFHYEGNIDNVRVWGVARTQTQIQDNMYSNITSSTNLIASFDFEEGEPNADNTGITELVDGTGTANGAWNGFALTGTTSNYVSGFSTFTYDVDCPSSTTWNGSSWSNGAPDAATHALITGDLTITSDMEICDAVVLEGATLTIDPSASLTVHGETGNDGTMLIKADASGMGSLITLGGVAGSGASKMEQYLTGSGGATPDGVFYYVGSPVGAALTYDYNVDGDDKLWTADETTQSYTQQVVGAISLIPSVGYVARMGSTQTITFNEVGSNTHFNTGNQSASGLTRTGTTAVNRGYNLIGNPYPSTVSWDDAARTNLETTLWYRTHQGTTMLYDTYNASGMVGTNNNGNGAVTGDIPPTQAFWVRVNADGNTGSLSFDNADRSHGTLAGIYKTEAQEGLVRMALSNGSVSDETIVLFNADADDAFDDYDSQKFWASNIPQLYMNLQEDTLVINGLNNTLTNPTVPLGMKVTTQGNYTLNANDITVVGETVHLEDTYLNIFQDLNVEPNYAFTSDAGNIGDRFVLHFGMAAVGIEDVQAMNSRVYTSNGQLNIILSENAENGNVQVLDMAGRTVDFLNLNANRTAIEMNVNSGIYLIRVETEKGIDTHRILID